jgi:hypothetical protein
LITKHHSHQTDKITYHLRVPSDNGFISTDHQFVSRKTMKTIAVSLLGCMIVSLDFFFTYGVIPLDWKRLLIIMFLFYNNAFLLTLSDLECILIFGMTNCEMHIDFLLFIFFFKLIFHWTCFHWSKLNQVNCMTKRNWFKPEFLCRSSNSLISFFISPLEIMLGPIRNAEI